MDVVSVPGMVYTQVVPYQHVPPARLRNGVLKILQPTRGRDQ